MTTETPQQPDRIFLYEITSTPDRASATTVHSGVGFSAYELADEAIQGWAGKLGQDETGQVFFSAEWGHEHLIYGPMTRVEGTITITRRMSDELTSNLLADEVERQMQPESRPYIATRYNANV